MRSRLVDTLADLAHTYDVAPLVDVLLVRLAEGLGRQPSAADTLLGLLARVPLAPAAVGACVRALLKAQLTAAAADTAIPALGEATESALRALQHKYPAQLDDALAALLQAPAAADTAAPGADSAEAPLYDILSTLFQVGSARTLAHRR